MKRQANFEVLRVVAMAMIVAMHFMQRAGILQPLSGNITVVNATAWLIETFCIVAANCYVLIAGYFLIDTKWQLKKLIRLVGQVWFYSMLIPAICFLSGIGEVRTWSVYEWVSAVLPLQTDHYWFATAYVLLFMLSPVLAAGVKQLSKKQLEITIGVLLIYFSGFKSISPILLATDNYGYDYPWFICLYLIAAYVKLYGSSDAGLQIGRVRLFSNTKKSALIYVGMVLFSFGGSLVLAMINERFGKVKYLMDMMYSYNHVLTIISSLACFFMFKNWKCRNGKITQFLCKIAPYTFGVYLIHENMAIRNEWTGWFRVNGIYESLVFVPYMILVIICVFAVCMMIDFVRTKIFSKVL